MQRVLIFLVISSIVMEKNIFNVQTLLNQLSLGI